MIKAPIARKEDTEEHIEFGKIKHNQFKRWPEELAGMSFVALEPLESTYWVAPSSHSNAEDDNELWWQSIVPEASKHH